MPKILKTKRIKNKNKKEYSKFINYLLSAVRGLSVCFIIILIVGLLLYKNNNFTFFNKIVVYIAIGFGAFVSGLLSNKKVRGRGITDGLYTSLLYSALIFILVTLSLKFNISLYILTVFPTSVSGGIIGGIVGANT